MIIFQLNTKGDQFMQSLPVPKSSSLLATSPPAGRIPISSLAIFGPSCFKSADHFIKNFTASFIELYRQNKNTNSTNAGVASAINLLNCREFLVPNPVIQNVRAIFNNGVVKIINREIKIVGHDMNYLHLKIDPESELCSQINAEISKCLILRLFKRR